MRVETLTFLRFIAAVIVVIFHFGQETGLAHLSPKFLTSGPPMVTFFFVLSGFVLVLAYYPKEDLSVKNYYMARIARIVPIYLLALGLKCFFDPTGNDNSPIAFFLNFTFLQAWFPPYPLSANSPAWSVSVEAFFYLVFPMILAGIKGLKVPPSSLLLIGITVWGFTQAILTNLLNSDFYIGFPSASHDLINYFPLSHLGSFLLGISGGYIFLKRPRISQSLPQSSERFSLGLTILGLGLTYGLLENQEVLGNWLGLTLPTGSSFFAPWFLALILGMAHARNTLTKYLSLRPFVVLGESSYALYILQVPIQIIYAKYLRGVLSLGKSADFYAYLLVLIAAAVVSFYLIEKPSKKLILTITARM